MLVSFDSVDRPVIGSRRRAVQGLEQLGCGYVRVIAFGQLDGVEHHADRIAHERFALQVGVGLRARLEDVDLQLDKTPWSVFI
jgi:hypothetical protein